MGLANVVPPDDFLDAILRRAEDIANFGSPRSIRIMKKRQLAEARYQTLGEATYVADREIANCRTTEDFKEGIQHFIEKRTPNFTGR